MVPSTPSAPAQSPSTVPSAPAPSFNPVPAAVTTPSPATTTDAVATLLPDGPLLPGFNDPNAFCKFHSLILFLNPI